MSQRRRTKDDSSGVGARSEGPAKSTAFKSPAVPRPARWRSGTVGAGLVLASGCATPTLNQRVWSADARAFLSHDFGGPRAGHFGLGLETRLIYAQQQFECSQGS